MTRRWIAFTCVGFLLLAWLASGQAATYYVSKHPSANNGNACTSPDAGACATVTGGNAKMSSSDTLVIQAGTYVETMKEGISGWTWRNGSAGQYTRYARYQNDVVVIKPTTAAGLHVVEFAITNKYIELDGLIIDATNVYHAGIALDRLDLGEADGTLAHDIRLKNGAVRYANAIAGVQCPDSGTSQGGYGIIGGHVLEIINMDIHDNQCYGMYAGSSTLVDGSRIYNNGAYGLHFYNTNGGMRNSIIRNSRLFNNGHNAFDVTSAIVIQADNCQSANGNNQVYNNVIYANNAGIGVAGCGMDNNQIYNNTIVNNSGIDGVCISLVNATNTLVRNNLCYQNGVEIRQFGGSATYSNNLCGLSGTGCSVIGNPQLVDAPGGNLHLLSNSPAIGAGTNLFHLFTTDADGLPRPSSGAWTIGAYVFSAAVGPTGQVLWFKFDEGSGGTVTDHAASPENNAGTVVGHAALSGAPIIGTSSLTMDGNGDYVDIANSAGLMPGGNRYAIMAFLKMSQGGVTPPHRCTVATIGDSYIMEITGGFMTCWYFNGSEWQGNATPAVVNLFDGNVHQAVCSWEGHIGVSRGYVDNLQRSQTTITGTVSYNQPRVRIGASADTTARGADCNGLIDEVELYDRDVSVTEVNAHFQKLVALVTGYTVTAFQWREADKAQGGGWQAGLNDLQTIRPGGKARLRVGISLVTGGTPAAEFFPLYCQTNQTPWTTLTRLTNNCVTFPVCIAQDTGVNMGDATTAALGTPSGFTPMAGMVVADVLNESLTLSMTNQKYLEMEYAIGLSPVLGLDTTITCPPRHGSGAVLDTYAVTPTAKTFPGQRTYSGGPLQGMVR